jgi:hypothetical protein
MSLVIKRILILVPALVLSMTGCGTSAVAADDVATEAERVLAERMGEVQVDCPDDTLDMTATVTTVEGDDVSMEFNFPEDPPATE